MVGRERRGKGTGEGGGVGDGGGRWNEMGRKT